MSGVLLLSFAGCSKDSFTDIYAFTYYYNKFTDECRLSLEDYLLHNGTYSTVLEKNGIRLHLALKEADNGKIEEIRLLAAKVDENGNKRDITAAECDFFCERLRAVLSAYTTLGEEGCEAIIGDMRLENPSQFSSEGELTLTKGDWHTVYYSNALASVFTVTNIHLRPVEKTEKPVSKPDFGNTAYTREENKKRT